jgi:hypothetical protein
MIISKSAGNASSAMLGSLHQAALFLLGSLLIWYASHPISHYITARIFGVRVLYFYVGRSELRNAGISAAKSLAPYLITIGTKLDRAGIISPRLSRNARAFIYGSGAIVSGCVAGLIFVYSSLAMFSTLTVVVALLFFLFSSGNEIVLSTRSGDLAKMRKALGR